MTIQQLEYIVALNKFRHFVKASEHCGVAQPTLSMMIRKLETELDVVIFDRKKQPIEPTAMGKRLIAQAEISLKEMRKMGEMVEAETEIISGPFKLGVIPTLAPYLVPKFINLFSKKCTGVELSISEMTTASCIEELKKDNIDMFIAATPLEQKDFFEIPLYYERFVAYFASDSKIKYETLSASNMPKDDLWVLEEGHCLRDQTFNFCKSEIDYNEVFEAGSIDTLVRIIDINGGYSVIPELHLEFLTEDQKKNVTEITSPPAVREISLVIKQDFIKERLINAVADVIKQIIPEHMLDERMKKYSIRL